MSGGRGRWAFFVAVLLAAAPARAMEAGEPLAAALAELRRKGLQLIFSSALVEPEFIVKVDPGSGSPEQIARRILAPYGLTLEPIRPGVFVVVKRDTEDAETSTLEVHVSEPDGTAIAGARVTLPRTGRTAITDARGIARMKGLGSGRYDILVEADGRQRGSLDGVELRRGGSVRVALVLEPELPLFEIDVYASRYRLNQQHPAALAELTRRDIETLAGLEQDALRVTRYLPGTAANPLSARAHVRGGRQDEVAVFFDGIPLFEPFHYKDIQSLFGILDPGTISSIEFFSGVFPVRYGDRLSGVLDIRPRRWTGENQHELGASLLYSHGLSQGRLEKVPVEWLAAVRHSNIDFVADTVNLQEEVEPNFLDALLRLELLASPRSTLTAGWLFLDDELQADISRGVEQAEIRYRDATGWATWRFRPRDAAEILVALSHTERHTDRTGSVLRPGSASGEVDDGREFDTTTARAEGTVRLGERWQLGAGLEGYHFDAEYDYRSESALNPLLADAFGRPERIVRDLHLGPGGHAWAAYASAVLSLTPALTLDAGLRWDAQRYGVFEDRQISPRIALQYRFHPATVLRVSWGRMAQTERPDELQVQDGETQFHPAQRGTQTVLSVERHFSGSTTLRFEAFDKRVSDPKPIHENLLDPFALLPELEIDRVRVAPDRSRAYGAELSVRWHAPRTWSAWGSYSFSEVSDRIAAVAVPRSWEQKHAVSAGVGWTRYPWQLTANLSWHSGWRRNELRVAQSGPVPRIELAPRNSRFWPDYLSLDLRATWTRALPRGALEAYAEVTNALNTGNPCCVGYSLRDDASGAMLIGEETVWMPRLMVLGVRWRLP